MKSRIIRGQLKELPNMSCDECGEEFVLKPRDIHTREYKDGIHINYFGCPFCGQKYVCSVTDPELRRLIKQNAKKTIWGVHSPTSVIKVMEAELLEKYRGRIEDE